MSAFTPPLLKLTTYICTLNKFQCDTYKRQRPKDGYNLNIHQQRPLEPKWVHGTLAGTDHLAGTPGACWHAWSCSRNMQFRFPIPQVLHFFHLRSSPVFLPILHHAFRCLKHPSVAILHYLCRKTDIMVERIQQVITEYERRLRRTPFQTIVCYYLISVTSLHPLRTLTEITVRRATATPPPSCIRVY